MVSNFSPTWYAVEKLTKFCFENTLVVQETSYIGTSLNGVRTLAKNQEDLFNIIQAKLDNEDDIWLCSRSRRDFGPQEVNPDVRQQKTYSKNCQYCTCEGCFLGKSPYNHILACEDGTKICDVCYEYPPCYRSGNDCDEYKLTGGCKHRPTLKK